MLKNKSKLGNVYLVANFLLEETQRETKCFSTLKTSETLTLEQYTCQATWSPIQYQAFSSKGVLNTAPQSPPDISMPDDDPLLNIFSSLIILLHPNPLLI